MSIIHGQPPSYTESQVMNASVGMPVTAAQVGLQTNLRSFTKQEPQEETPNIRLEHELPQNPEAAAQFETFKQNIYKHPLFPLLAMVFEKCEASTAAPDAASHCFEKELQAFMKHHETLKSSVLGEDEEVNELMIKGVQVLRIHLLEMEKVSELCRDFCARYTTCLRGKLTSEQLLHVDGCDDDSLSGEPQDLSLNHSPQNGLNLSTGLNLPQQQQQQQQSPSAVGTAAVVATPTVVGGNVVLQAQPSQQPQIVSGNTVYQMVHTPQGIVAQPIQIQGPLTPVQPQVQPVIHGSTPLSQIGIQRGSDEDEDDKGGKQKRGILPKQATQVMKSWLFQHIVHPYPTEDEKRQIAAQTNLTLLQVNNWFINARRRILQPMLEAANPDKSKPKKPNKPGGNKPQQRFWPGPGGGANPCMDDIKQENTSNSAGGGAESESDSTPNPVSAHATGTTTTGPAALKAHNAIIQNNNNNNSVPNQQQQQASLKLPSAAALQQLMATGGMVGGGGGAGGVAAAALTAERLQQLQQQMQVAASTSLPSTFTPSFSSAQPSSVEAAALLAQSEAAAYMGCLPGSGVVFKLSPDGQLVPSSAPHAHPLAQANPAPLTLDSLQALQQAGFVVGPSPLPFSLPLGVGGTGLGLGLGFNPAFPGFSAQTSTATAAVAAAAASSALSLGALNFASAYNAPLQFANYLNAATPIDLSSMSNPGALQLGQVTNGGAHTQLATAGQVLMGLPAQESGGEMTSAADDDTAGDEGLEAGELKIDTRDLKPGHNDG
ncbi:homeobox protein pknox2-like [Plakobranchus ocellatus]|uniref:Homeobox protein pknox2-like n=1 Tax=Plakobranchus ocellatus TaxID=259542 RepID=A0AAV3YS70_9GAST|nr:homeobox protein pknox2-like [Plakobranchus ocellatus]